LQPLDRKVFRSLKAKAKDEYRMGRKGEGNEDDCKPVPIWSTPEASSAKTSFGRDGRIMPPHQLAFDWDEDDQVRSGTTKTPDGLDKPTA
jgi:hypothetical protein